MKKLTALFLSLWLAFAQIAWASSITTTGAGAGIGNTLEEFDLIFTDSSTSSATTGSYNFTLQSLGTDIEGLNIRYTVVVVESNSDTTSSTLASATIAGVSADIQVQTASDRNTCAVITADTSGLGTSGTIAISFSGVRQNSSIGVYSMINPLSITPDATVTDVVDVSGLVDVSLTVVAGGRSVSGATVKNGSGGITWVGATEKYDTNIEVNDHSAGALNTTAAAPQTITAQSADTTPDHMSGCSATWH